MTRFVLVAAALCITMQASADVLFSTGTPGSGQGGVLVPDTNFFAQPFRLTTPTILTGVSWQLSGNTSLGRMSIVELTAPPVYTPSGNAFLSPPRRLAEADFTYNGTGVTVLSNFAGPPTRLREGWYAAVITNPGNGFLLVDNLPPASPGTSFPYSGTLASGFSVFQGISPVVSVLGSIATPVNDPNAFAFQTASRASTYSQTTFIGSTSFQGARFTITRPTLITEMGGIIGLGSGSIFAAIVQLASPTASPSTTDLSQNVVATALLDASGDLGDRSAAPINPTILQPGSYALILGSGLFGATGSAQIPQFLDLPTPSNSTFVRATSNVTFWADTNVNPRLFVNGTVVPAPAAASTLTLLGLLATRRRRA